MYDRCRKRLPGSSGASRRTGGVDIFAFGVIAFELVSFRRPFGGATFSEISVRVLPEQPPSLLDVAPGSSP